MGMKWFTLSELLYSRTAVERRIWNGATAPIEASLTALTDAVLDPARERYGRPVFVSSGYRCPELNRIVGGSRHSQHLKGEAADLYTAEGPEGNLQLARIIVALGNWDQLILENVGPHDLLPKWVHVSWKPFGPNRHEIRKCVAGTRQYLLLTEAEIEV